MTTSTERVRAAYAAIAASERPEIWITIVDESEALACADAVDRRVRSGARLPLAGYVGAIKDNIDFVGTPTTAGCPSYAYAPTTTATCVARLIDAGLVVIGKTNLDQFATGLVGTRSPYGAVRSAGDLARISGGSSSGSAVAVALGLVDIALGTDTAGSGRVPAALNGIIGLKPTRGLVPIDGVVPACASFDCVSTFARDVSLACSAVRVMGGTHSGDPSSRAWPGDAPLGLPEGVVVAVPDVVTLSAISEDNRGKFSSSIDRLASIGVGVKVIDVSPFLEAGKLLYGGAFVAERYASVGEFVDSHRSAVDPVVGAIVSEGGAIPAARLAQDITSLATWRVAISEIFADVDALMLPTVGEHPTIDEVRADPRGVNTRLGTYTTFCNLLDLAAIAIPVRDRERTSVGSTFGVTLFAPAFHDQLIGDLAARFLGETSPPSVAPIRGALIVVVGAHLMGQPLNNQLTSRGGRLVAETTTSPHYRLFALSTSPPKPGLVRVAADGASIAVEVWELPPAQFADFVAAVPPPLSVGQVTLTNGEVHPGFVLTATDAPAGVEDITDYGGWRSYLHATKP
jgi:allophanate hydrolase